MMRLPWPRRTRNIDPRLMARLILARTRRH